LFRPSQARGGGGGTSCTTVNVAVALVWVSAPGALTWQL